MDTNEQDIKLIERYLDGGLDAEEQQLFNDRKKNDPEFNKLVHSGRLAIAGIKAYAEKDMRQRLQQIHFEEMAKAKKKPSFRIGWRRGFAIAASIAILVVAGIFLFRSDPTAGELYQAYYKVPAFEQVRSGTTGDQPADERWRVAQTAYQNADYSAALSALDNYLILVPNDANANYFKAICQIELDQLLAALTTLSGLTDHPDLGEDAHWLRALVLIRQNNKIAAQSELQQLIDDPVVSPAMQRKAVELLDKVERMQ